MPAVQARRRWSHRFGAQYWSTISLATRSARCVLLERSTSRGPSTSPARRPRPTPRSPRSWAGCSAGRRAAGPGVRAEGGPRRVRRRGPLISARRAGVLESAGFTFQDATVEAAIAPDWPTRALTVQTSSWSEPASPGSRRHGSWPPRASTSSWWKPPTTWADGSTPTWWTASWSTAASRSSTRPTPARGRARPCGAGPQGASSAAPRSPIAGREAGTLARAGWVAEARSRGTGGLAGKLRFAAFAGRSSRPPCPRGRPTRRRRRRPLRPPSPRPADQLRPAVPVRRPPRRRPRHVPAIRLPVPASFALGTPSAALRRGMQAMPAQRRDPSPPRTVLSARRARGDARIVSTDAGTSARAPSWSRPTARCRRAAAGGGARRTFA